MVKYFIFIGFLFLQVQCHNISMLPQNNKGILLSIDPVQFYYNGNTFHLKGLENDVFDRSFPDAYLLSSNLLAIRGSDNLIVITYDDNGNVTSEKEIELPFDAYKELYLVKYENYLITTNLNDPRPDEKFSFLYYNLDTDEITHIPIELGSHEEKTFINENLSTFGMSIWADELYVLFSNEEENYYEPEKIYLVKYNLAKSKTQAAQIYPIAINEVLKPEKTTVSDSSKASFPETIDLNILSGFRKSDRYYWLPRDESLFLSDKHILIFLDNCHFHNPGPMSSVGPRTSRKPKFMVLDKTSFEPILFYAEDINVGWNRSQFMNGGQYQIIDNTIYLIGSSAEQEIYLLQVNFPSNSIEKKKLFNKQNVCIPMFIGHPEKNYYINKIPLRPYPANHQINPQFCIEKKGGKHIVHYTDKEGISSINIHDFLSNSSK